MKTTLMGFGLAAVFLLGTACFGLFTRDAEPPAAASACADLDGQAKADCEARQGR